MNQIKPLNTWQLSFTFELLRNNYLTALSFICNDVRCLHCLGIKGFPSMYFLHEKITKVTNHVLYLSTEAIMKNFTAFLRVLLNVLMMYILMNRENTINDQMIIAILFG